MPTSPDNVAPVSVVYRSRGALLVYGEAEQARAALAALPPGLKALAVTPGGTLGIHDSPSLQSVPGTVIQVSGHLGRFRASAAGPQGALDLGLLSPNDDGLFDLVLDLYPVPLIDHEVPPLGYVRTGGSSDRLMERLQRFSRWIGTVNKPRYFHFAETLCAQDRQGVRGCRRCLDACPAGAIHAGDGGIAIDPYLCQGCGTCALVCPTGAASYARPKPRTILSAVADLLRPLLPSEGAPGPVLVLHAGAEDPGLPAGVAVLRLPTLAAAGMEIWLSALALGASRVLIQRSGLLPTGSARILERQVDLARQWLRALGQAPERLRLIGDVREPDLGGLPNPWSPADPAPLTGARDKRAMLTAALTHLGHPRSRNTHVIDVGTGAPFGTLSLNRSRCTLCHACASLCPTGALRNRAGALAFAERNCVQCGLCVNGCPERALEAAARLDPDTLVSGERVLKPASEMFCCSECGTPFAPRSLVEGSMAHVRTHPMFQGDGLRLLTLCMSCRQRATVGLSG